MKRYFLYFGVLAPMLAITLAGINAYYMIAVWDYDGPNYEFVVNPGDGFARINHNLNKADLISNAKIFHRYAQVTGVMTKFKSGRFLIKKNSTMLDVMTELLYGVAIAEKITIPEGKNLFEIAKLLESKKIIKSSRDFIRLAKSTELAKELGIPAERVEGYLYPDTYRFSKSTPEKSVIKLMVSEFKRQTKKIEFENSDMSVHEVITLASIVEKETGAGHERPMIAGVFLNRLKKRMRLQSDPTTIYGIYENFNGNLRKRHLQEKTPYNTYRIGGLPKGPISNPGILSIKAVLNPTSHSFLYFVSQNDGTHAFSKTYRQHIQAVNKWQKNRKNRVGKSWRDLKAKK
jgi:UPF0755 protein